MELVDKAINIKGKQYVLVSDRVIYFNENYPEGSIHTALISQPESPNIIVRAVVIPDVAKPNRIFSGYSQATVGDGYINKTSALENAETSAVGRALGFMGIGVIESIASADEVNKATGSEGNNTVNPKKVLEYAELLKNASSVDELNGIAKNIPAVYHNEKFIKFVKDLRQKLEINSQTVNAVVDTFNAEEIEVTKFQDFKNRVNACNSDVDLFELETELEAGGFTADEIKKGKTIISNKSKKLK